MLNVMKGRVSRSSRTELNTDGALVFADLRLTVDFFAGVFLVVVFFVAIFQVYTLVFKFGLNYNERNYG